jgi:hypothetical protein
VSIETNYEIPRANSWTQENGSSCFIHGHSTTMSLCSCHKHKLEDPQMPTDPSPDHIGVNSLTKADLAFVDAAIALQRDEQKRRQAPPGAPVAPIPALFGTIFIVAYLAYQAAVFVYHAVTGRAPTNLKIAPGEAADGLLPSAALDQVIAARNEMARVVRDTSVLQ